MVNRTILYLVLSVILFILLGWIFSDIFFYFIISIVISSILKPLTNYVNQTQIFKVKIPRFIAVVVSFFILFIAGSIFINLFIPLVSAQIELLSGINYSGLLEKLTIPLQDIELFLIGYNFYDGEPGFLVDNLKNGVIDLISELKFANVLNFVLSTTGNLFIGGIAILFITFFLLFEMVSIRKKMISLIPNKYFEVSISAFNKIDKLFSNYLIGLLLQMFAIFSLASIGLGILGIKYALTIAVFAAVANLIPYLGPTVGSLFGIIVAVSTGTDLHITQDYLILFLKIVSVFATIQLIDNVVFQPLIFSKSVRAHPLEIFVVIFAGATIGQIFTNSIIGGMIGMISAIPVYTILRVSGMELYTGYKQYKIFKN